MTMSSDVPVQLLGFHTEMYDAPPCQKKHHSLEMGEGRCPHEDSVEEVAISAEEPADQGAVQERNTPILTAKKLFRG